MIKDEREVKCTAELEGCRETIKREKRLIAYHKDMLKKLEKKEVAISVKLENFKVASLFEMLHKGGYDIDNLRNAVRVGDFTGVTVQKPVSAEEKGNTENIKKNELAQTVLAEKIETSDTDVE